MKRVLFAVVAALLMAAPCLAQCSSGSCSNGGMAAVSGAPFRVGAFLVPPARAYVPGVQARVGLGRNSFVGPVTASGYRHDISLRRGPLGLVWYGRSRYVPASPPSTRNHQPAPAGVESRQAK
jgi:hypothetical protein